MKEGAGEDPFADDAATETDSSNRGNGGATDGDASTQRDGTAASERSEHTHQSGPDSGREATGAGRERHLQIPYKFRRDGVQDGRDRVPLFLQPETKTAERDALRELEDRFDENVSLTDLREAVVKTGLSNLDDVERHLEEWGYGVTFDE